MICMVVNYLKSAQLIKRHSGFSLRSIYTINHLPGMKRIKTKKRAACCKLKTSK